MTLKEKFDEVFIENWLVDYAEECEKVTDDFAIGFAEWLALHCYRAIDGNYWLTKNDGDIKKTPKELLEIYKKEKGL
jgi:hypothetical protein